MKAAFFMKNGGPEVMQYGDVPDPVAGPGQVLVDVHAASVNAADWKRRAGHYAPTTQFPYVPGRDFSGVVSALGSGVADLRVGDAVFDTVGGEVAQRSFAVLRPGGRAASVGAGPTAPVSPRSDVTSLRPKVGRDRAHLERIVALVASGAVRLPEIRIYSLSQAVEAHRVSEGRHLRGKLVFKVR